MSNIVTVQTNKDGSFVLRINGREVPGVRVVQPWKGKDGKIQFVGLMLDCSEYNVLAPEASSVDPELQALRDAGTNVTQETQDVPVLPALHEPADLEEYYAKGGLLGDSTSYADEEARTPTVPLHPFGKGNSVEWRDRTLWINGQRVSRLTSIEHRLAANDIRRITICIDVDTVKGLDNA